MISDTRFRMKYSPKGKQIPQENLTVLDDLKEEVAALKRQVVLMTKSIKQRFRRKKRPVQPSNSSHVIEVSHLTEQKKGDDNTRQHPNRQTSPIARTAIIPTESKHEVNQSLKPSPPPRRETIRRWRC
jgi:LytS/YehU family sensor histidine kinase